MARKPTGNPNGRPPKEINQKIFEGLCAIQCTEEEICDVLDVDEATLLKWCRSVYGETFSEVFKKKKMGGKASLRRMQWKLAEKNATVAIWLGKQYLGQTDKVESEIVDDRKIEVEIKTPTKEDYERVRKLKEGLFKDAN